MYCKKCGKQLDDDALFCSQCGAPQKPQNPEPGPQDPEHRDHRKAAAIGLILGLCLGIGLLSLFSHVKKDSQDPEPVLSLQIREDSSTKEASEPSAASETQSQPRPATAEEIRSAEETRAQPDIAEETVPETRRELPISQSQISALSMEKGTYMGEVVGDQAQGWGTLTWPSGSYYEGQFEDGLPRGTGTYYDASGPIMKEQYREDWTYVREQPYLNRSFADWMDADKTEPLGVYTGMAFGRENRPSGYGQLVFTLGGVYEGSFLEGFPKGAGTYVYRDGTISTGTWDWERSKSRVFQQGYPEGTYLYDGLSRDGQLQGFGGASFQGFGLYQGEFWHDEISGYGRYTYRNPVCKESLEGDSWRVERNQLVGSAPYGPFRVFVMYLGDTMNGFGISLYPGGEFYVGEFTDHYYWGQGKFYGPGHENWGGGTYIQGKPAN